MLTRDDLRQLAVLTALGAVLGLVHLGLRPDLPVLADPAEPAACVLPDDEPSAPATHSAPPEPIMSSEPPPLSPLPEAAP